MHPAVPAFRQFGPASVEDKVAAVLVVEERRKLDIVAVPFSAEADAEAGSRSCWETVSTHSAGEKTNMLVADTAEEVVAAAAAVAADIAASSEDTPCSSSSVTDLAEKCSLTGKSWCANGRSARSQRYPRKRHRAGRREKGGSSGVGNLGGGIDLPCFTEAGPSSRGAELASRDSNVTGQTCSLQRFIMVVVPAGE